MKPLIGRAPRCLLAFALLGTAFVAQAGSRNMILNGSFEYPDYVDDGLYGGGGNDWTGSFLGPRIIRGNVLDQNGVPYGTTRFGAQFLSLAGVVHGTLASDAQLVSGFVAGGRYTLTVFAADLDGNTNPRLEVKVDDGGDVVYVDKLLKLPVGGPYQGNIEFHKLSMTFTSPVTGALRLTLANPVIPDDGLGLVAVDEVVCVPAAAGASADASTTR